MKKKQDGVVLMVALVMVLIMTILGIASVRGVALSERMSGNAFDRNLAFQAAEAALRAGELTVLSTLSNYDPELVLTTPQIGVWQNVDSSKISLGDLIGGTPQFRIDYMGSGFLCNIDPDTDGVVRSCAGNVSEVDPLLCSCMRFRVLGRNTPTDDARAQVTLQSIFYSR